MGRGAKAVLFLIILVAIQSLGASTESDYLNRWLRRKPYIQSIEITGNRFFSDGEIRRSLFSRTDDFLRRIKSDRRIRVQRETPLRDTSEIKYLYLTSGFLGVKVQEQFVPILPDSNALVKIDIHEGRRFYYSNLKVHGDYPETFNKDVNRVIARFKKKEAVDPFRLKQATYDLKSSFANKGYPYALVDFKVDTTAESDQSEVIFNIQSDSLVHFGELEIVGNEKYASGSVRREITFRPGDIYSRSKIIDSQKRLLSTGNYLTMQLYSNTEDTLDTARRLKPGIRLTLKEKNPHYVSIKTGASQDRYKDLIWGLSVSWGKRNLLGSRLLELSAYSGFVVFTEWRVLYHNYRARFTEPWFLGIRMPMTLTGEISPGVRSAVQPYRIQTWSISLETFREFNQKLKITTGLEYRSVNIYGLSPEEEILYRQDKGINVRRIFYNSVVRDSRNNPFVPVTGSMSILKIEYAGGILKGDDNFYRGEASWSRYQKVWPGWISASRLKMGYVKEFGDSRDVPIDARFYAGGANSIRGYAENDLGPRLADGTPSGANLLLIANQEFRFPLIGKLWGSFFADAGNGFFKLEDIKLSRVAFSYGLGFQFISPAGPIRLDYARRIDTDETDPGYRFHFTILYAF